MAKKQINIVIDTMQAQYSTIGTFKQLDSVFFNVQITEQGIAKDLTGQTLKLYINKADKKVVEQKTGIEIISATEGKITIDLLNAALQAEGFAVAELNISDAAGSISTVNFNFRVAPTVANDNFIESSNEISTLKEVEVYVAQAKKEIQDFKKLQGEMSTLNNSMKADEQTRKTSENTRVTNENTRKTNETSRVTKENERIANETTRSTNETTRVQSENLRKTAEATRVSNENLRKTNEASRTTAETARLEAEKTRVASEATRNENEETRKTNETDRVEAEKVREQRFEEMESSSTLFEMTKEINEAKGDKETLKLKLIDMENRTAENVAKQYLEASTSDGSLKVENCYNGLTKDLNVKGRTLQNLCVANIEKEYVLTPTSSPYADMVVCKTSMLKTGKYLFKFEIEVITGDLSEFNRAMFGFGTSTQMKAHTGITPNIEYDVLSKRFKQTITFSENFGANHEYFLIRPLVTTTNKSVTNPVTYKVKVTMLEGEPQYIPQHFEGIKSLGEEENKISILSCGSNLCKDGKVIKVNSNKYNTAQLKEGETYTIITNVTKNTKNQNSYVCLRADAISGDINIPVGFVGIRKNVIVASGGNILTFGARDLDSTREVIISEYSVYKGDVKIPSSYEEYKEDKKDILIPVAGGAKGFDNGVADEQFDNGDYLERVGRKVIAETAKISLWPSSPTDTDFAYFTIDNYLDYNLKSRIALCNKFIVHNQTSTAFENISLRGVGDMSRIYITITKSKLETADVAGFKKWLQQNPTTVYYELAEPILHKAQAPTDLNLATFKEITHISCLNKIAPSNMSAKFPVDLPATISRLTSENKELLNENIELQNKANALTLENEMQQLDIDINMLATIDLFEMMVGTARSVKGGDRMVEVYVSMIIKGKKKLEDVPAIIRPQVEQMLIDLGIIA